MSHLDKIAVFAEGGAEITVTPEEVEKMLADVARRGYVPSVERDGELNFYALIQILESGENPTAA